MGKSLVSDKDFPLDQSIEIWEISLQNYAHAWPWHDLQRIAIWVPSLNWKSVYKWFVDRGASLVFHCRSFCGTHLKVRSEMGYPGDHEPSSSSTCSHWCVFLACESTFTLGFFVGFHVFPKNKTQVDHVPVAPCSIIFQCHMLNSQPFARFPFLVLSLPGVVEDIWSGWMGISMIKHGLWGFCAKPHGGRLQREGQDTKAGFYIIYIYIFIYDTEICLIRIFRFPTVLSVWGLLFTATLTFGSTKFTLKFPVLLWFTPALISKLVHVTF